MKTSFLLAGTVLAACFAGAAVAQSDAKPVGEGAHHHMEAPKTRADVEARVKERFARLDVDKDGFITPDELRHHGMHPGGPGHEGAAGADHAGSKDRADRLFAMMDTDKNGQISRAEFDAFHAAHMHGDPEGGRDRFAHWDGPRRGGMWMMHMRHEMMARRMFEHEDADHGGKVSLAEAEKAALDRFDKVDTNHDGVISDAERQTAREQMAARFRERRAQWQARKGDMPPPPPATQG